MDRQTLDSENHGDNGAKSIEMPTAGKFEKLNFSLTGHS
jgi:hypothetical protein